MDGRHALNATLDLRSIVQIINYQVGPTHFVKLEERPGMSTFNQVVKFKKTNTTLAHYTIQEGSCLPVQVQENKHHIIIAHK